MSKSTSTLSAFDILLDDKPLVATPACVLVGDEGFLTHETRRRLVERLAGAVGQDAADVLDGDTELRDVFDALSARSLFGGELRIVVVENAEGLVKEHREALEDYVARPFADATLVLEVASWPGNTRLAKAVASQGLTVDCRAPDRGSELVAFNRRLTAWLVAVAKRDFQTELAKNAVEELIELLPSEVGVLYQEVARLALLGGGKIDAKLVRQHVGGWRIRQTWDMIDAAADGRAADAVAQLDRLLSSGEQAQGLLPQMASTLRRFAVAVRLYERAECRRQSPTLRAALQQAGVPPFKLGDAERQLRQIGRPRARRLNRWLLEADLELKGRNSAKPAARRVIETLIMRLSREAGPAEARGRR